MIQMIKKILKKNKIQNKMIVKSNNYKFKKIN